MCVFFFKQKTAYEMRISDWSSDVCSTDLLFAQQAIGVIGGVFTPFHPLGAPADFAYILNDAGIDIVIVDEARHADMAKAIELSERSPLVLTLGGGGEPDLAERSEEHTSELQSLMRISYAVFCLTKKIIAPRN